MDVAGERVRWCDRGQGKIEADDWLWKGAGDKTRLKIFFYLFALLFFDFIECYS